MTIWLLIAALWAVPALIVGAIALHALCSPERPDE